MAIPTDPEGKNALTKIVSRRLKAARKAAGMSQASAAMQLNHKGITQVSLAEEGHRLPPILDLVKYAELYGVPVDFLLGLIDDPIAEACEQSQGAVLRSVKDSLGGLFTKITDAVAGHVSISVTNLRQDRADLVDIIKATADLDRAIKRMLELNPEFEELRGSSTVENALLRFRSIGKRVDARTLEERRQFDMIDRALSLTEVDGAFTQFEQFRLGFDIIPTAPQDAGQAQTA